MAKTVAQMIRKDLDKNRPFEDGTIIAWDIRFNGYGETYHYAALYCNNQWVTTAVNGGDFNKRMSHAQLMQQLSKHEKGITNLRVATAFEAV